jgi:xanthine dehydrogenase iron-sulfur cluster and FAD-binding subunit A
MRASHEYRQRVARNLLTRFHADLAHGRSTSVWSYAG